METKALSIVLAIFTASLCQNMHAVSPPPDGGYPGGNTAEGDFALLNLTDGGFNTAVGYLSLRGNTQGDFNTAVGAGTLLNNTTASENTAIGAGALLNTASGFVLGGDSNTANGAFAAFLNSTGSRNTAMGDRALFNNTSGSDNIAIGASAGSGITTANDVICIGATGANGAHRCYIANIRGVTTANNNALPVVIDSAGQLGTMSSSRQFKKDIKPMHDASEAILALKPVTFHYKSDSTNRPEFGLIAEDVAKANPDLVVRNDNGDIYTVRYDAVNAMLLNEFLKEHHRGAEQDCKIQEQETTIAELRSEMKALAATVNEQASQLQKVSAWLEKSEAKPQFAQNK